MATKKSKIHENAMLVRLACHKWGGKKQRKAKGEQIAAQNGASRDACDLILKLVPQENLNPINSSYQAADKLFKSLTMAWFDGGWRIVPNVMFADLRDKMNDAVARYRESVEHFLTEYPQLSTPQIVRQRLGKLSDGEVLPSVQELRQRFSMTVDIMPIPDTEDWRVSIAGMDSDEIRSEVERTMQGAMSASIREMLAHLGELVGKIHETMADPDKQFKGVIIEKLRDYVHMIPTLNLTGDSDIEEIRSELEDKLTRLDAEMMRNNPRARKAAARDARKIMNKVNSIFPVK